MHKIDITNNNSITTILQYFNINKCLVSDNNELRFTIKRGVTYLNDIVIYKKSDIIGFSFNKFYKFYRHTHWGYLYFYIDFETDCKIVISLYEKLFIDNQFNKVLLKMYKYKKSNFLNRISSEYNDVFLHLKNDDLDYYFKIQPTYILT